MAATRIPDNTAAFTAEAIVEATGATQVQSPDGPVEGVVVDSRRVTPGNLFVALQGERHDAHAYVGAAIEAGARAVVVDRNVDVPEHVGVFRVRDTLAALGELGRWHRSRHDVPVVAITGSVGKTSTKELIAAALGGAGRQVLWTRGNLNNRIGVPMTLLTLGAKHDAAVLEIGMNTPGEIADLTAMVQPTIGVVTAVAAVHTERVGGIEGVAREKGSLLEALGPGATAIWCADYERIEPFGARSQASQKLRYGRARGANVRLSEFALDGYGATVAHYELGDRALDARLPLLGEAAALNAGAALAVVRALEPGRLDAAVEALANVPRPPHRMHPIELSSGTLLIDDTYNASPHSTRAALRTAAEVAARRGGRLVAVLGDMFELGSEAGAWHAETGRDAVREGAAVLFAVGEWMGHAAQAARQEAVRSTEVVQLVEPGDVAPQLQPRLSAKDVVLIKGSRGMRMERVVDALRPQQAQ